MKNLRIGGTDVNEYIKEQVALAIAEHFKQIVELQEEIRNKNSMIAHIYDGLDRELLSKKIYTQSEMETTARALADSILLSSKPPTKWYDNIPEQGVLCWVQNNPEGKKKVVTIYSRKNRDDYETALYCINSRAFDVTPLTNEEIEEFKR